MASMQGISYAKPEPFKLPTFDYAPVQAAIRAVDLSRYYANLLEDSFTRDVEDFTYGIPAPRTKHLLARAADGFDWKPWHDKIAAMGEHYKLKVSGIPDQGDINVHFVHRKSDNADAIPLLLVHGWPGSIVEFNEICEPLSQNYHIVMPSIPGFAYSDAPKRGAKGKNGIPWSYAKTAVCFNAIMLSVGYTKYATQGGDWGSMTTRYLALSFPENVKAVHLNYFSAVTGAKDATGELSTLEKKGIERRDAFKHKGSAYQEIQGTVPYTLGAVLSCSPAALIIYIAEKMYRWSSPDKHPSDDEVIANCMLYWFTGSITSSFWLYYFRRSADEEDQTQAKFLDESVFQQPVSVAFGKYEIHWPPKHNFTVQVPNVHEWKQLEAGSHFLALEEPELLARDIDRFFQSDEVRRLFG